MDFPAPIRRGSPDRFGLVLFFLLGIFVGGAIMGGIRQRQPRPIGRIQSEEFDEIISPFRFVEFSRLRRPELVELAPNEVLGLIGDKAVFGITFASDKRDRIETLDVHDEWGRCWVNVSLDRQSVYINQYEQPNPSHTDQPKYTIEDNDADGNSDRRINWVEKESLCPINKIEWGPCPKREPSSEEK